MNEFESRGLILSPSHLTPSMAARILGVTPSAVLGRMKRGTLPVETHWGVKLIPAHALMTALDLKTEGNAKAIMDLKGKGYTFQKVSKCRACGEKILWALTPKGKRMPFNAGTDKPHWDTCQKTHRADPKGRP